MLIPKIQKNIHRIFAVLLLGVFAYFVLGEILLPADDWGSPERIVKYSGAWERVWEDGTRTPQQIPGKCKAEKNEMVTVESVLPKILRHDSYLCFRSAKQDMKIYIDGELRRQYSTKDTRAFGKTSAVAFVFLEIQPEDTGKTLRLETRTDSSYSGIFYEVYIGNQVGIWQYYMDQYGMELIIALLMFILSIVTIIGSRILQKLSQREVALEYLGWGIHIASVWLIANSVFRQLIFPNLSVINDIAFYMVMLLPLPFLIYMNRIQKRRYQTGYFIVEILAIADFVMCTFLHTARWYDFTETIFFMALICILTILFLAATIFIDFRKGFVKEYHYVASGIFCACVASVIQLVMYFQRTSFFNGVFLAVGLIFLLVFAVINTIHEIIYIDWEKQQAVSASEAKGRFLANMSHEIRTPINAVLGMNAMILRESREPQIREYAQDIQHAGQGLLSLVNDILDLSKIESGKVEILPIEYDFSSLLHDVMNMVAMKAESKNLTVNLSVDEKLPSRLWGDDVRIRQILVNLMNNAVKYTETGGVTLTVTGTVEEENIRLRFAVEDTGVGIREEDLEKLFREFERIEEQKNRNIEGTGLGMSITTRLLQIMGSSLQVESTYGVGSVFSFELEQKIMNAEPIGDLEERIRTEVTKYSYQVSFNAPDADILIVDDNAINRRVFVNLLKETKVRIEEAASGMECLEMIAKKHYDIIFLDHMMPEMDGIETLHRMQAWRDYPCQDTPVIALTANAVSGAREMYLSEGFHDFLSKPINAEKLEKMIVENLPEEKVQEVEPLMEPSEEKEALTESATEPFSLREKGNVFKNPEDLPEIDGIDWDFALFHLKDKSLLMDTVQDFYQLLETESAELEKLWQRLGMLETEEETAEEYRQFRVKVHSMKSSAAMIGAVSLSGVAKMLEYAARDCKREKIDKIMPAFLEEWQGMKDKLSVLFCQEEKLPANNYMTVEYLRLLRPAIEDMDIDTADEIIAQLRRFQYADEEEAFIEKLGVAVMNIDIEQTKELADRLEEKINHQLEEER